VHQEKRTSKAENRPQVRGRQHYVPEFYLSGWVGDDGQLWVIQNFAGKIFRSQCAPKATGFGHHIYSYNEEYSGADRAAIETKFFSRLDDEGAKIVSKLINGGNLEEKERVLWTQFLAGLHIRTPTNIAKIKSMALDLLTKEIETGQAEYTALKKEKDPDALKDWVNLNHPGHLENIAIAQIPKVISQLNALRDIHAMSWHTVDLQHASNSLFTSDRPLVMTGGLQYPDCIIALPLSPRYAFLAFRTESHAEKVLKAATVSRLAIAINNSVVGQAEKYAYCFSAHGAPDMFFQRKLKPISKS